MRIRIRNTGFLNAWLCEAVFSNGWFRRLRRESQEADPVLQLRRPERRGEEMWPTQDLTREIQVGETAWQI